MGLAEILAAKKAAALAANSVATEQKPEEQKPVLNGTPPATPIVEAAPSKPLSFAEKMALKKKSELAESKPATAEQPKASVPLQTIAQAAASITSDDTESEGDDSNIIRNQYAEIAAKIDELVGMSPSNELTSGMASLKRSLMANPAACELMLDEDIGKMVTILRRIVGEEITAVKEGKAKPGRKPKAIELKDMSADDIMAALDDL